MREFHIARRVRERYNFREELFSSSGNVVFQNFHAVRLFVQKINETIDLVKYPERALRSGLVNAMGLVDEILHFMVRAYRMQMGFDPFVELLETLDASMGPDLDDTLLQFTVDFPPRAVYQGLKSPEQYLEGSTDGTPNRVIALEELVLLWLANANRAFDPFKELFDDANLKRDTAYKLVMAEVHRYFRGLPTFGPDGQHLMEMLQLPAIAVPDSLPGQLRFIRERWAALLGRYLYQLLSSLDLIREEEKSFIGGPGPAEVYSYSGMEGQREGFSPDMEWMPKVVLVAKSTLVWLDQLSKKYQRPMERLDQIPDEELDILRDEGFTALWLIGLWERSPASKRIKQLSGNADAEASAYSLRSYNVAPELGGWEALANLRERLRYRGIRLACDMVPNHTGIDSEWIINRPERFIQLPYSPYPGYTYGGENLSRAPGVGIFLEDHYFDRTDAAVTFKRVDFNTGEVRYIYHGNDGTHTPWNDTAQLNYLDPKVREAVIDTILHVARNFPIIRFDAAMTLAKQHIQRLWYPVPGSGGDVPSRSEHAMSAEDFDRAVPTEFWREVVDRVAAEQPDTLLLAEAFWMMEGYFVRSLGMHRVYNSAFMNMLKDEENSKYRAAIKNTLEFDPEILKRFVNFMNNPDEETAVLQFGAGDKYFGVCTMMVTMPGLPMFGHGQIEGLREKYGMEYRKARWDERPDGELIERHKREIFPLMKSRYLFAEVENFQLYDLVCEDGSVNDNIFAYSNRRGGDCALVVYNNRIDRAAGWINLSAPYARRSGSGRTLERGTIGQALGLRDAPDFYALLYEQRSRLWYLRRNKEILERGLFIDLAGYQCQVFLRFREVQDTDLAHYRRLAERLEGRGIPDVDEGLKAIFVEPIHAAFGRFMTPAIIASTYEETFEPDSIKNDYREFLIQGCRFSHLDFSEEAVDLMSRGLSANRRVQGLALAAGRDERSRSGRRGSKRPHPLASTEFRSFLRFGFDLNSSAAACLVALAFLKPLARLLPAENRFTVRSLIDEWMLAGPISAALAASGASAAELRRTEELMRIIPAHAGWYWDVLATGSLSARAERLFEDEAVQRWLGENRYDGILWFNREAFLELVWWLFVSAVIGIDEQQQTDSRAREHLEAVFDMTSRVLAAMERSQYRVESLIAALRGDRRARGRR